MISGGQADRLALLLAAVAVLLAAWWFLRTRPTWMVLVWACVIGFVPFWFGVNVIVYVQPASAVGALLVACVLSNTRVRVGWVDVGFGVLCLACLLPALFGLATLSSVFQVVTQWGVGYAVGRLLPERAGLARVQLIVGAAMAVVGLGAMVEFLLSWNPFVEVPVGNALYAKWAVLQERGGILRAEWAFGHSIALGASLGLTVPLVLGCPVRWQVRAALLIPIVGGAVVGFSRIGIATTVAGIVLSLLFLRNELPTRLRVVVSGVLVVAAAVATPLVTSTFAEAGSEATNSAAYRGDLSSLVPAFALVGFTDDATRTAAGELYFGRFQSIDSAIVLMGLTYGWLALVTASVLLAAAGLSVLARRASPPVVAVVAHLPALATVALITQYAIYFWFVVGLAAYAATQGRPRPSAEQTAPSWDSRGSEPVALRQVRQKSPPSRAFR